MKIKHNYPKVNNGGEKCKFCPYIGEHYCKETPPIYKSVMLPAALQEEIKLRAAKAKITIIEYITNLLTK